MAMFVSYLSEQRGIIDIVSVANADVVLALVARGVVEIPEGCRYGILRKDFVRASIGRANHLTHRVKICIGHPLANAHHDDAMSAVLAVRQALKHLANLPEEKLRAS